MIESLPQNDEAERSVLGAVLVDNDKLAAVSDLLSPEDFYRPAHQHVFRTMLALAKDQKPIDILTVSEPHASDPVVEAAGGIGFLSKLMDGIPRLVNAEHYAGIVRDKAQRRRLVKLAHEIAADAAGSDESVQALVAQYEAALRELGKSETPTVRPFKRVAADLLDEVESRMQAPGQISGLSTGFAGLDDTLDGLQAGELTVVGARPALGKTALATCIAVRVAKERPVLMFSMEMPSRQVAARVIFGGAHVKHKRAWRGELNEFEWSKTIHSFEQNMGLRLYIDDTAGLSVEQMRRRTAAFQRKYGLGLVVVDYIQIMGGGRDVGNRAQEVGAVARGLKLMARQMEVPVLALAQLSRSVDSRENKKPTMSDLRESGEIEQEAAVVAFLYRQAYYDQQAGKPVTDPEGAEIIVSKNRFGSCGTVKLRFIPEQVLFIDPPAPLDSMATK